MPDVIFERIAPVVTVHDLDAALTRYRRLGFATDLDEPAQYGFVERGGVQAMVLLKATVVNVTLPAIGRDLGGASRGCSGR